MNHEKLTIKNKEWIGRIPSDWDFVKIKEHFVERNTKVDDISFPPLSVSMGGVVDQIENVSKSDDSENRKLVKKNDFVINSRSDRKGSSGISPRDGSVSLINIVLKPKNISPKYSEYLFKSYYFKEEFFRNGKGIHFDLWSTRYELMKQIIIPYPKIEEQNEIVEYLDNKTHQIEKLTKKIEKKIELLKEQRISLINEVVTKGLNPNVEMKDSGIEWIGEIPRHWNYKRMCHMFRPVSIKNNFDEMNLSVYRDYGVIPTHSRDDNHNVISEDTSNYKLVDIGDFVMNKMKCWMGSLGLSDFRGIVSPSYTVMKPLTEDNRKFLHFLLRSKVYIHQYKRLSYGIRTGQWDLHYKDFRELPCLIPPLKEQKEIVKYLEIETQRIDKTISIEEKKVELLKEYKQSLISEVVTGKKRVV